MEIPVIDISGYYTGNESEKARIANELHAACCSPGFFQIVGHSVSPELRSRTLQSLPAFFALAVEKKTQIHRDRSTCLRGYEQVGAQRLEAAFADQKEGFMIGHELSERSGFLQGPNQWPAEHDVPGFRATLTEYFRAVHALSKTMFRILALSLRLSEAYFDDFVSSDQAISMCRSHRYPPTTAEKVQKSRGIGAHTDFGALTLLLQDDLGGLEVYHRLSKRWYPVKPVKDAFVVNIGDMLERWTNNKYSSTLHRVISPVSERDRFSVAFFNEGLGSQVIECIPSCLAEDEKALYAPITAEEHLRSRTSVLAPKAYCEQYFYLATMSSLTTWRALGLSVAVGYAGLGAMAVLDPNWAARVLCGTERFPAATAKNKPLETAMKLLGARDLSIATALTAFYCYGKYESMGQLILSGTILCMADVYSSWVNCSPQWGLLLGIGASVWIVIGYELAKEAHIAMI